MLSRNYAEKLQFLVSRRFPDYWRQHKMEPSDPRVQGVSEYETELASLSQLEFDERYIQAIDEHNQEQAAAAKRADRLEFFDQPDAEADFRFWCHLEQWSLDEAAALLLCKNPTKVTSGSLHSVRHESPFRRSFEDLKTKLRRAVHDGKLQERDSPLSFIGWAERIGVAVPPELSARLEAGGGIPIEGRERASMLRLIIGMATKHYGYDEEAAKSPVPKQIADDLAKIGLELGPQTILKFLREAAALLPAKLNKKDSL